MSFKCPHCMSPLNTGGQCPIDCQNRIIQEKNVQLAQYGILAGYCGKCGAPYYHDGYAGVKPICACWNMPKVTISNGTKD